MPNMRYFEALVNGLRRDNRTNRNTQFLTQCANLIPTEWGLKQLPTFTYPFASTVLETLTNGTFTGNATSWTLGVGWAYDSNNVTATAADNTAAQQLLADQVSGNEITSGIPYRVTFTISSYTSGTLTPKLGTVAGTSRSSAGTFTEVITSDGTDLSLLAGTGASAFTGTIDSVSVAPAWPNPVLLSHEKALLLAGPNQIFSVNGTTWETSALTFYDAQAITQANTPAYGGIWQLASFQDMWFLTNGTDLLYKIPSTASSKRALLGTRGESVTDGDMSASTYWDEADASWVVAANTATATTSSTTLTQTNANQVSGEELQTGVEYTLTYTYTRSAGTLTPSLGTTAGTTVSAAGPVTVTENIIAGGATPDIVFTGVGFTGTVDDVSVTRASTLAVNAIANHNNRLVLGGCSGNYFTHSNFTDTIFETWRETTPDEVVITDIDTFDTGWIIYSAQAGGDNDVPFMTLLAMFNTPSTTLFTKMEEIIVGAIETGEMGMLPLKRAGDVYVLKPLGNDLVVYGKNSISILRWGELPYKGGSKMGYREQTIADFGVASRGAVNGDEQEHVFVTKQGDVYRLSQQGLQREGYDEFVGALTLANIVVAHDPLENFYWISDGTNGFCLTRTGLGGSDDIMPTSIFRIDATDGRVGAGIIEATAGDVTVETELFDGEQRQAWEVGFLEISTTDTDTTGWQGAMRYRLNKGDALTTKTAETFDDRGRLRVKTPGVDFAVRLTAADRTKVDLERLDVIAGQGKLSLRDLLDV